MVKVVGISCTDKGAISEQHIHLVSVSPEVLRAVYSYTIEPHKDSSRRERGRRANRASVPEAILKVNSPLNAILKVNSPLNAILSFHQ
jgi:hypothetical protein